MQRKLSLCCFLLLFVHLVFCQKKELKTKFGKLSDQEIAMKSYAKDPAAPAVVLFDKGNLSHRYDDNNGFSMVFERHARIKVFSKEALSEGDIFVFHPKSQKLGDLKATTYNLENGKMVETKLDKDNVFDENITKNFTLTKFTIPAVKEGSIIEFSYRLVEQGGIWMPSNWTFQKEHIPTIWSEFEASIPEFIEFKKMAQGWVPFSLTEEGPSEEKLSITLKDRGDGRVATTSYTNVNLNYTVNKMHFIQEDIPALKPERYVNSSRDYLSMINFDVRTIYSTDIVPNGASYRVINTTPKNYNLTWRNLGKELLEDVYEDEIKTSKNTSDIVKTITAGKATADEKMAAIYEYIGVNYQLKEYPFIWVSTSQDKLVKDRKGSATDLNLLYINMLSKAGLKAYPVLISTTSNGTVIPFRVSPREFDRVIAAVEQEDGGLVLVDVSAYSNPIGLLCAEDINGEGLLLKAKDDIQWIPLVNKVSVKTALIATMELNADGGVKGNVVLYENGYEAVSNRIKIREKDEESMLKEKYVAWATDGGFSEIKTENARDWNTPGTKIEFKMITNAFANVSGDKIYVSPLIGIGEHENPFKNPDRKFNIDLGSPNEQNYNLTFKIPQGYKVEETPKSVKMAFGDNDLTFDYVIDMKDDIVKLVVKKRQKKSSIESAIYPELQQFFSTMVSKMEEQIVLTKI
ncbi:MAG: DUF3857 domain-containing protein [Bacteroidetes bacterium]|nr:DUF3857 domain-containing protein [Bacteroidota bacterium]